MKVLFDTSVLVAALVKPHPRHARALPWLKRAITGEIELVVGTHTLAELYSTLTSLPVKPRISPHAARRLIEENVEAIATIVVLSVEDYADTLTRSSNMGLAGGVIYDALIARVGEVAKVERLLTFNVRDFRRVWPKATDMIMEPAEPEVPDKPLHPTAGQDRQ